MNYEVRGKDVEIKVNIQHVSSFNLVLNVIKTPAPYDKHLCLQVVLGKIKQTAGFDDVLN